MTCTISKFAECGPADIGMGLIGLGFPSVRCNSYFDVEEVMTHGDVIESIKGMQTILCVLGVAIIAIVSIGWMVK